MRLRAGLGRLLDEVRDLVAERVDLDGEAAADALVLELDHPVEQDLPVAVAGEIVVGDEESVDALRPVLANDLLEVVGRAEAALAALHVDDRAERALIGTAAAEVDRGIVAGGALEMLARQDRRGLAFERRQMVHVIVERLQFAIPGVEQNLVEPALLGFPREQRDAERLRVCQFGRHFRQHREAAGDMESADANLEARGAKLTRKIDRARELVRLDADDADQRPAALALEIANDPARNDATVGLVIGVDFQRHARAQHFAAPGVLREAVHAGQRIGGQSRAEPLDRVALVVVMRGLDQHEGELRTFCGRSGSAGGQLTAHKRLKTTRVRPWVLARASDPGKSA